MGVYCLTYNYILFIYIYIKVGPLLVINGVITPLIGVKKTKVPIYKAVYRGYNSIYNWWGPTLNVNMHLLL